MARIDRLRVFTEVVQTRNFTSAAKHLNLTPSAVSKQIGMLEDKLGVRLLHRTTRTADPTEAGQLYFERAKRAAGLKQIGENLYAPTAASGDPQLGAPREDGRGQLLQHHLEASNVDPVTELVSLIRTQRAFEMNSQSIQAADEVLQQIGNLRRF